MRSSASSTTISVWLGLWPRNQRGAERVFRQLVLARLAAPGKSKRHHAAELSEPGGEPAPGARSTG